MSHRSSLRRPGKRILALDDGGAKGLAQLAILCELMRRIGVQITNLTQRGILLPNIFLPFEPDEGPRVSEVFDLTVGSGTGAFNAVLLGRLGMTIKEVQRAFVYLSKTVFANHQNVKNRPWDSYTKNRIYLFDSVLLESTLKAIIQENTGSENTKMRAEGNQNRVNKTNKVMVCVKSVFDGGAAIIPGFRTYISRGVPDINCEIWQAIGASMAHPTLFEPISIKDDADLEYPYLSPIGHNNPSKRAQIEVRNAFNEPNLSIQSLVSIGTGKTTQIAAPKTSFWSRITHWLPGYLRELFHGFQFTELFLKLSEDCEKVHNDLANDRLSDILAYYRLNVEQGLQDFSRNEWDDLAVISTRTKQSLEDNSDELDAAVERIVQAIVAENPR